MTFVRSHRNYLPNMSDKAKPTNPKGGNGKPNGKTAGKPAAKANGGKPAGKPGKPKSKFGGKPAVNKPKGKPQPKAAKDTAQPKAKDTDEAENADDKAAKKPVSYLPSAKLTAAATP